MESVTHLEYILCLVRSKIITILEIEILCEIYQCQKATVFAEYLYFSF